MNIAAATITALAKAVTKHSTSDQNKDPLHTQLGSQILGQKEVIVSINTDNGSAVSP
jgi:hypothetical protein